MVYMSIAGEKQAKLKTDTTTAEAKDLEDHSRKDNIQIL